MFLELVLQDEILRRSNRKRERLVKQACFRDQKRLDRFDWTFNPQIPRQKFYQFATNQYLKEANDILLLGPPGVGKSHLTQALGFEAIKAGYNVLYSSIFDMVRAFFADETIEDNDVLKRYLKPDLLIIDDMGMKQLPKKSGEFFFEVILRRHEKRSTIMTSNRPLEDWGKLIGDVPAASAILDRFLQRSEIIAIEGPSYRLRDRERAINAK